MRRWLLGTHACDRSRGRAAADEFVHRVLVIRERRKESEDGTNAFGSAVLERCPQAACVLVCRSCGALVLAVRGGTYARGTWQNSDGSRHVAGKIVIFVDSAHCFDEQRHKP